MSLDVEEHLSYSPELIAAVGTRQNQGLAPVPRTYGNNKRPRQLIGVRRSVLRLDLRCESLPSNATVLNDKGIAGEFVRMVCCFRRPNDVCVFRCDESLLSAK